MSHGERRQPTITVFGSSRVAESSPHYQQAYHFGRMLGERGWNACTGGYDGVMAAVSRGVKERGGRTIGCLVDVFGDRQGNDWIDEPIRSASLLLRLDELVQRGDAYVGLPGGVGTLLEIALVWNLIWIGGMRPKPIILVGDGWSSVIESMATHLVYGDGEFQLIHLVPDVEHAIELLDRALGTPDL